MEQFRSAPVHRVTGSIFLETAILAFSLMAAIFRSTFPSTLPVEIARFYFSAIIRLSTKYWNIAIFYT